MSENNLHTTENCEKLAETIVDHMDLKDLMRTMQDIIEEQLQDDTGYFDTAWEDYEMDEK